jgi:putative transcription factor
MACEMCGAPGKLFKTILEGANLNLCQECSRFGKVIGLVEGSEPIDASRVGGDRGPEVVEIVVDSYASKIKGAREVLGMNQKEFAKKLNEKESIIQKIESGHFDPPIGLAKKIGKILQIRLVEQHTESHQQGNLKQESKAFTLGDFINVKKK